MTAFGLALRNELTSLEAFFLEVVNVSGVANVNGASGIRGYGYIRLGSSEVITLTTCV
jgi:hypothetical protein